MFLPVFDSDFNIAQITGIKLVFLNFIFGNIHFTQTKKRRNLAGTGQQGIGKNYSPQQPPGFGRMIVASP